MSADEPSEHDDDLGLSPDAERRIAEIVEQFVTQLHAGVSPSRQSMESQYPDLAPVLGRRLEFVARIFQAVRTSPSTVDDRIAPPEPDDQEHIVATTSLRQSTPATELTGEQALHLRCPHCGNPIQLVQLNRVQPADVTCGVCGSTVHVDPSGTLTRDGTTHPARINRFTILSELGRGSFGVVYQGQDPQLQRTVAIKVPRAGYFVSEEEKVRFLREARNSARLRHPRIVQVHEVVHEGNVPCIVSDFIDGVTLNDMIIGRQLSFRETAELVAQVADALEYAHRERIIHRDVKPSNILVDHDGSPHVTDFGLARLDDGEITMTIDGDVLGTPAFMSPEQAEGKHSLVDRRTDVYSLGVVLYRMLSGELPFRGSKRMTLLQVIHDDPRPPRSLNDKVPRDLETIALKAMHKSPDRRYATARELADDLRRWLQGEPIYARPIRWPERCVRWCRRHRAIASLAASVVFMLATLAAVGAIAAWREYGLRLLAVKAQELEASEHERAEANARTSRQRLADMHLAVGIRQLEENDYFAALSWFASAMRVDREDPARLALHRLRFATTLDQCPKLAQLWMRPARITHAIFSGDSRRILSAGDDGVVEVLDGTTGERLILLRHAARITAAALSPDGQRVASSSLDKTVFLSNVAVPSADRITMAHREIVDAMAFSPDGLLVATGCRDKRVRLWSAATGTLIAETGEQRKPIQAITFRPDGKCLVATIGIEWSLEDAAAQQWDVPSLEPRGTELTCGGTIHRAAYNPSGSLILTCCRDGTVRLWDAETCAAWPSPMLHDGFVVDGRFSPDGNYVITASFDGTARVWKTDTAVAAGAPLRHPAQVRQVAMSPNGRHLATSCNDGSVRVWQFPNLDPVSVRLPHAGIIQAVAFDTLGLRLLTAGEDGSVKVWELPADADVFPAIHHGGSVTKVRFAADNRHVLSGGVDRIARLWNLETRKVTELLHDAEVLDVHFTPSGDRFATACDDGAVRIGDTNSGQWLPIRMNHEGTVHVLAFSPLGNRLVSCGGSPWAKVWDSTNGQLVASLAHSDSVFGASFSPDGKLLATSGEDRHLRIWNTDSWTESRAPLAHSTGISTCEFSPNGRWVATRGHSTALLWDLQTGTSIKLEHTQQMSGLAFSPDGQWIATGCSDGTVTVWEVATGRRALPYLKHGASQVFAVKFSSDSRLLASSSGSRAAARLANMDRRGAGWVWDLSTGQPATPPLRHQQIVYSVALSPDLRRIVTSGEDGSVKAWRLEPDQRPVEDLQSLAELLAARQVDASFGLVALGPDEMRLRWEALRTKYPESFTSSTASRAVWGAAPAAP